MTRQVVLATAGACVAATVLAACDWPWRHDMVDQPSPSAARGPRAPAPGASPLSAHGPTDPAAAQGATNPLPAGAAETSAGRNLYAIYCVPCHGASGTGVDSAVAKYFPRVGDLSGADVQQHEDGWLYAIVTSGTSTMPSYGHELTTRERWQIVRFVRTLAR